MNERSLLPKAACLKTGMSGIGHVLIKAGFL